MSTPRMPVTLTPVGFDTSYIDEQILQYQEQDAATRTFANSIADLLLVYFVEGAQGRFADCLKAARDSWVAMRCCGTDRQIARLEKQRADLISTPFMYSGPNYNAKTPEERMVRLIEERDALAAEIEQAQRGLAALPVEGMGDVFEASIISPMHRNLKYKELEISALQEQVESHRNSEGAATPGPRKTQDGLTDDDLKIAELDSL
jgi:hypothetical protein